MNNVSAASVSAGNASPRLVMVSGLSGAGKATVLHGLEDHGFFAIENLPVALAGEMVAALSAGRLPAQRLAVVMDCRDPGFVAGWSGVMGQARGQGIAVDTVFVEAVDEVLLRRFSQMRRRHPTDPNAPLAGAIAAERVALAGIRAKADHLLDTSTLSPHELRRRVLDLLLGPGRQKDMRITVVSFGFKNGPPTDIDMLFDVRFMPNPYFVPSLKELNGQDQQVADYVLQNPATEEFLHRLLPLILYLVPQYGKEGKAYLTIGVGCTGGKHRSVAVAQEIIRQLGERGIAASARHRDLGLE